MKRMKYYAFAAVLWLCGTALTTSCTIDDNPVRPSAEEQEAKENRDELIRHIENDAKTMADIFKMESLTVASQAYEQLLALMKNDKAFLTNMRVILSAVSEKQSLLSISPVKADSELAKMGYLLYMTADNSGFYVLCSMAREAVAFSLPIIWSSYSQLTFKASAQRCSS